MRLIPVLDIQNGIVVRGIGGRRDEYRPLMSCLTTSCAPLDVARSLIQAFHPRELYVADLNAIAGRQPSWPLLADSDLRAGLWIDAGIRTTPDIRPLAHTNVAGIVIGLETVSGPNVLDAAISEFGRERLVFSLDLRGGRLLGNWTSWNARDDRDWPTVVARALQAGIKRLILLDLEKVGEGEGTGTEEMCRIIASTYPALEVICGGGVRGVEDLHRLAECGAAAVLVASALHGDTIKPTDWRSAAR